MSVLKEQEFERKVYPQLVKTNTYSCIYRIKVKKEEVFQIAMQIRRKKGSPEPFKRRAG